MLYPQIHSLISLLKQVNGNQSGEFVYRFKYFLWEEIIISVDIYQHFVYGVKITTTYYSQINGTKGKHFSVASTFLTISPTGSEVKYYQV